MTTGPVKYRKKVLWSGVPELQDWHLIELKYDVKDRDRQFRRTVLYIQEGDEWKVGDAGGAIE